MRRAKQTAFFGQTEPLFADWPYSLPDEEAEWQAAKRAGILKPVWERMTPLERVQAKENALASIRGRRGAAIFLDRARKMCYTG